MKKELINNCPLCKSEVELIQEDWHNEYHLDCTGCALTYGLGDDGEMHRGYSNKDRLIKQWNEALEA